MSNINIDRISLTASGDTLVFPVRELFAIARDEITALEGGKGQAFWFSNLGGAVAGDGAWHPIPLTGGGMTGDATVATADASGLTLLVEAVVQIKLWVEFAADGTGGELVGVQLNDGSLQYRGQLQLNVGETMLAVMYDGWLLPGVVIGAAAMAAAATSINANSYVTAIVTPTGG